MIVANKSRCRRDLSIKNTEGNITSKQSGQMCITPGVLSAAGGRTLFALLQVIIGSNEGCIENLNRKWERMQPDDERTSANPTRFGSE